MSEATVLLAASPGGAEAAALLSRGRLQDFLATPPIGSGGGADWGAEALVRGEARRLLKSAEGGQGAAFLHFGADAPQGYLAGAERVREGDVILAEIRVFPSGAKAWPLTRRLSLRSRRLVLTPGAPGLNLSRAIKGERARSEMKSALARSIDAAAGVGCVARSAAGVDPAGLEEEAAWLMTRWRGIEANSEKIGLKQPAPGAIALALRDWSGGGGASPQVLAQKGSELAIAAALAPSDPIRSHIEQGGVDLFDRLDVWAQAQSALAARQTLPSSGALSLETTTALTTLDVDSGEGAAPTADIEAARELPRLLRIGGHGGLIAADFLARSPQQRGRVESALKQAFRGDPVETEILGWTAGGVLELRRKRSRRRLTRTDLAAWFEN